MAIANPIALSETEFEDIPVEKLLDTAKKFGIEYVELWTPHCLLPDRNFDQLKAVLDDYDIKTACISTWTQLNIPEDVPRKQEMIIESIRLARHLGAGLVNTYSGHTEGRGLDTAIAEYAERIAPCLKVAEENDVTIVLENEFDTTGTDITRRADDILRLVNAIGSDRFKLNYDPANFYIAGEEPYPYAYEVLKDHIVYVHIKDAARRLDHKPTKSSRVWQDASGDYYCVPFDEGAVNFYAILRRLLDDGYDGFLSLEPHLKPEFTDEGIEKTLEFFKRI